MAAAIGTTGAATKLLSCGLSDAKLHDIPSFYIFPISSNTREKDCALQDTSAYGSNVIQQLKAELPNQVFVLDNPSKFEEQLHEVSRLLHFRKTVVLFLDNDVLTQTADLLPIHPIDIKRESHNIGELVAGFERTVHHKRIILIVGEQAIHCPEIKTLTTQLCQNLKAAVIWSMNGVNCVDSNNPYVYGCVSFGGNDHAVNLLQSINQDDVVLAVGLCPDEYTTNLQKIGAGHTYFLTDVVDSYGQIDGEYKHHALQTAVRLMHLLKRH